MLFTSFAGRTFTAAAEEEPGDEGIGHYVDSIRRGVDNVSGLACIVLTCLPGDASRVKLSQWTYEMRFLETYPEFASRMCAPSHLCYSREDSVASAVCAPGGRDVFDTVTQLLPGDEHAARRQCFASQLVLFATRTLVELAEIGEVKLLSDLKPENVLFFGEDPGTACASEFRLIDFGIYSAAHSLVELMPSTKSYCHPKRQLDQYACARDVLFATAKMYFTVSALTMDYNDARAYVASTGTFFDNMMLDVYDRTLYAGNDGNVREDCERIAIYMP